MGGISGYLHDYSWEKSFHYKDMNPSYCMIAPSKFIFDSLVVWDFVLGERKYICIYKYQYIYAYMFIYMYIYIYI